MRRILPELANIGALYGPKENQETIDVAMNVVEKLGVKLVPKSMGTPRDIPDVLESLVNNVDLLLGHHGSGGSIATDGRTPLVVFLSE